MRVPRYSANVGVKVGGRSTPIGRSEAIRAIVGHENGFDSIGANDLGHLLDRQFGGGRGDSGGWEVLLPEPKRAVHGGFVGKEDDSRERRGQVRAIRRRDRTSGGSSGCAMAASKLWSKSGRRSAAALMHGAASGDRCLTISSEGSTAQTTRSVAHEPVPAPTFTTV